MSLFFILLLNIPADMKKVLELDPANDQARKNIRRLEPIAAEKREKMKEEMIGKHGAFISVHICIYTKLMQLKV